MKEEYEKCRSGKRIFLTKQEAERALAKIRVFRSKRIEQNVHNCNSCKKWHLTSSKDTWDRRISKRDREQGITRSQKRRHLRKRAKEQ